MSVVSAPTMYTIGDWSAVNNGQPYVDADGCWWRVTTETGWSGSPAPRTNSLPREQADGDFPGPVFESGRPITLGGQVFAPDQVTLQRAIDRLNALLVAGDRSADLVVAEAHMTRQCRVHRVDEKPVAKVSPFVATWSLALYADDPVRYSAELHTVSSGLYAAGQPRTFARAGLRAYGALGDQGIVTVHNAGPLDAYPVVTLTAGPTDPLVNPAARLVGGNIIALNLTVAPNHFVVLNTADQSVLLDGLGSASRYTTQTSESKFWSCPSGDSQVLFTATSGAGSSMTVAWRDPYP